LGERVAAEPELHGVEAARDEVGARLLQLRDGQMAPEALAGVGGDILANAAEQAPERLVRRLALDVPEGDVDRSERQGRSPFVQQVDGPVPHALVEKGVTAGVGSLSYQSLG